LSDPCQGIRPLLARSPAYRAPGDAGTALSPVVLVAVSGALGDGTARLLSVAPASHDFGSVRVGSTSSTFTFTIKNLGSVVLKEPEVTTDVPFWLVAGTFADDCFYRSSFMPGTTCTVQAQMKPTAARSATGFGHVRFSDSLDRDAAIRFDLSGTGTS
jgi:hypothetical protein